MACDDTGHFYFKLNLVITQLEYIEFFPVQPHLPLWEGLYLVHCHASGRCLQRGKVMGVRYPGDNPQV